MAEKLVLPPGYSEALTGFNQSVASVDYFQHQAGLSFDRAHNSLSQLRRLRLSALEAILAEKGLAVCEDWHSFPLVPKSEGLEGLGIFPQTVMRRLYTEYDGWIGDHRNGHWQPERTLKFLCPEHFRELSTNPLRPEEKILKVRCGVKEIDGRLMTEAGGIDVTGLKLPIQCYKEKIYTYFGLPTLPEMPKRPGYF